MAFSDVIDTSLPAGTDDPSEADDNMRRIQGGFQELGDVEHDYGLTGTEITGTGKHTDITPDTIAVNTNKFTVDNDGNVVADGTLGVGGAQTVGGTLSVTGVLTTVAASVLGDGSVLAAATESGDGDRTIADKAYVDVQTAFSAYTLNDSESNTLVKSHSYKAATDGFVMAFVEIDAGQFLKGYVNTSDNPEGSENNLVLKQESTGNNDFQSGFFAVAKDEFFTITSTSGTPIIKWKSRGPLSAPVDQD